jgi:hypothetical protein
MAGLNWIALGEAPLRTDPFDHIRVGDALDAEALAGIPDEFPRIVAPGSFSLADARPGPVLQAVIADLQSQRFRSLMQSRFSLPLGGCSTTVTLRGKSGERDGFIHTDSRSKLLSLLLYLNEDWNGRQGQLRLLRSAHDIEDVGVEIPATLGSLVVFRRSDMSWHGHERYVGPRRVLQFNYVRMGHAGLVSLVRHRVSALLKMRLAA